LSLSSVDDDVVFGIPSTWKESTLTEERIFFCHKEIMGANYSLTIAAAEIHQRQNVFKQIRHKTLQANQLQKEGITRHGERRTGRPATREGYPIPQAVLLQRETDATRKLRGMGNHLSVFLSFFLSFADEREERIEAHTAAAATVGGQAAAATATSRFSDLQVSAYQRHHSLLQAHPEICVILKKFSFSCEQFSFFCERAGAIQVRIQWKRRKGQSSTVITRPAAAATRRIGLLNSSAEIRSLLYSH
jgi:hypothetical protein